MTKYFLSLVAMFVLVGASLSFADEPGACSVVAGGEGDGGCFTKVQIAGKDVSGLCYSMDESLVLITQLRSNGLCTNNIELCTLEEGTDPDGCFTVVKIGGKRATGVCYGMDKSLELIKQLRAVGACL